MVNERSEDVARGNWDAYKRALHAGHEEYVREAAAFSRMYEGDQWDKGDKAKLAAAKRPALTLNAILPTINAMIGEFVSQQAETVFKPRRSGVDEVAHALTMLSKQIDDNNYMARTERQVFSDGLIEDRGFFDIRMDFSDHVEGEIRITAKDPRTILINPAAKEYDSRTWPDIIESTWHSLDDISVVYGKKKAEKVQENISAYIDEMGQDIARMEENTFGEEEHHQAWAVPVRDSDEYKRIRSVRIVDRQYYKLAMVDYFLDPETGDMRQVPETWEPERAAEFAERMGLEQIQKLGRKVRWTVTAGGVVLHDEWSPYKHLTIVPFFPYFRRGKGFGAVRNLVDPQQYLNKITSQELHVVNTTANSGWIVEAGSLVGMSVQELEEKGAETGLVIQYGSQRNPPAKIQPNQIPSGLDRLSTKSHEFVRWISGVSESMLGFDRADVSGVAIDRKQQRGLTQLQGVFDNLNYTRQLLAERKLDLLQRFYTETRLIQVVEYESPGMPVEEVLINEPDPEVTGRIINDLTLGEYSVVISTKPARDTFQENQFAEAIEMRQADIAIPDHFVVEASNLHRKAEISQMMQELAGLGQPSEEEMELQQMMQQMQIQQMQLQLAELQAKAQREASQAELNTAKAEELGARLSVDAEGQQSDIQLQIQKMQLDLQKTMMTLENKIQLAQLHAQRGQAETAFKTQANRAQQRDALESRERVAGAQIGAGLMKQQQPRGA